MKIKLRYAVLCTALIVITAFSPILVASATTPTKRALVVGTTGKITHLDPHVTYWASDLNTYTQVCEGLFMTNLSDMDSNPFEIQPFLASGFGTWTDDTTWVIPIRQNIEFHDGHELNASTVVWNYQRIKNFIESGDSEWSVLSTVLNQRWVEVSGASEAYNDTEYLYIWKSFEATGEFEVTLELHYPDARALSLLAFQGWVLVSPDSHSQTSRMTLPPIVGTGPFTLDVIEADGSRTFLRWDDYWRGPADIPEVRYQFVSDSLTLGTGMLGGPGIRQYDVGNGDPTQWESFHEDDTLEFIDDVTGTVYFYAGMNVERIPTNHRKAIAYAANYTYLLEDILHGKYNPMYTPVSPGIPYSKVDCDIPELDIAAARAFMIAEGGVGSLTASSSDQDWIDVAEGSDPIATYNISYYGPSTTWTNTANMLADNAKQIGIKMTAHGMDDVQLDLRINIPDNFHMVEIFFLGWGPDYLDPHNMIYDAFAGPGALNPMNLAETDDPTIVAWQSSLQDALVETDPATRETMYHDIQTELMEDIVPWVMLFTRVEQYLHTTELTGRSLNPFGDTYWYSCTWNPVEAAAIPGYEVYTLFVAIGVAALFLIRKYRK